MTENNSDFYQATTHNKANIIDTLTLAFAEDPLLSHVIGKAKNRQAASNAYFDLCFESCSMRLSRRDHKAAALWLMPGVHVGFWDHMKFLPTIVRVLGLSGVPRAVRTLAALDKVHPTDQPHYYLWAVGVHPSLQGQDIGSQIIQPTLSECDAKQIGVYLETSNPRNLPWYQKLGFEIRNETKPLADAPVFWSMWRAPRMTD